MAVSLAVDTSLLVDGQNADAADVTTPIADLKTHLENTLNGVQAFDRISYGVAEALTIASDAITPTKTHVVVDTQGAASTDDLATINSGAEGRYMCLRITSAARVVVLKHGTGNIRLASGSDYTISSVDTFVALLHNGTNWIAVPVESNQYLNLGLDTTKTISGGIITKDRARHLIDTEASASSDDLDTISGGVEGDVLEITNANSGRLVVVTTAGNIRLSHNASRTLSDAQTTITLKFNGLYWVEDQQAMTLRTPLSNTLFSVPIWRAPDRSIVNDNETNQRRLAVLPSLEAARVIQIQASAATLEGSGVALPTIANTPTNANSADGAAVNLPSTAAAGNLAGFISTTFNLTQRQYNPTVVWIVRIPATPDPITSVRYWLLLTSAAITNVDTIAGATEVAGFRYSTVAGDTGWVPVVKNATTQSTGTAMGTVAANTLHMLKMRIDSASGVVYFSVRTSYGSAWLTESQHIANLPEPATDLGFCVRVIPVAASIRSLDFLRQEITAQ